MTHLNNQRMIQEYMYGTIYTLEIILIHRMAFLIIVNRNNILDSQFRSKYNCTNIVETKNTDYYAKIIVTRKTPILKL